VEVRLTHRGEQVCASTVASAFHRAARFTRGAAYALRAIPCGKGYNAKLRRRCPNGREPTKPRTWGRARSAALHQL